MNQPPFKADQLSVQSKSHTTLQIYLKSYEHDTHHHEDESIDHTLSFCIGFLPWG